MKAIIEIPDELYRKVKAKSALEGQPVREVTIAFFRSWVNKQPAAPEPGSSAYELMKDGCGIVDSGIGDLATNPDHMEGFGRD